MLRFGRRVGIAIGSVVMAYLAISLVAGVILGQSVHQSPLFAIAIFVVGGLIFADIVRRERRPGTDGSKR
jgi:4-hydroxybenzoate polyprenyltransferase